MKIVYDLKNDIEYGFSDDLSSEDCLISAFFQASRQMTIRNNKQAVAEMKKRIIYGKHGLHLNSSAFDLSIKY